MKGSGRKKESGNMLEFFKMTGSGNDFICIDNRDGKVEKHLKGMPVVDFVRAVCTPHLSLGADGVILLEPSQKVDFSWRFFNADGSEAEMCGNGGRCAARFAFIRGIAGREMSFETRAGIIDARVDGTWVKIRLPEPTGLNLSLPIPVEERTMTGHFINTGVPHTVIFCEELLSCDVLRLGRLIRFHELFAPTGTNVDFVRVEDKNRLKIRTYERGVEGETLACGTGSVAAALLSAALGMTRPPVEVGVASGEMLKVYFDCEGHKFKNVYLEGKAHVVCQGELWEEAYRKGF